MADDGTLHVVWHEPNGRVAHAIVKDDSGSIFRQQFAHRPIRRRQFDVSIDAQGRVFMVYFAELPRSHPDSVTLHVRRWNGRSWAEALLLPLAADDGSSPMLVRYGNHNLLSWCDHPVNAGGPTHRARMFSVLGPDGAWSYPEPLCRGGKFEGIGGYMSASFATLASDNRGVVHAAWTDRDRVHYVEVTTLE